MPTQRNFPHQSSKKKAHHKVQAFAPVIRLLGGIGERLRTGLPRTLRGDARAGDRFFRRAGDGERLLGDAGLLLGGDSPLRPMGDLLRGGESSFRREDSFCRCCPSFSTSAPTFSLCGASLLEVTGTAFGGGETFGLGNNVNRAQTTFPSI
eukprot:TRINITY_DN5859_c1_g1_i4.p1 TRINITY_DN5859_c1_g1~~TRINITY_DN5859_c1_g1_i4.p1  ORF type:complete len:151 (+),score=34.67 TRINITY_DN5859_c1_g1_i4:560-1012(+)